MVGGFYGVVLPFAQRPRPLIRRETPYERRLREPFSGQIIPFGSKIEYLPMSTKDQARLHQFGKKVFSGMFMGCASHAVRNPERETSSLLQVADGLITSVMLDQHSTTVQCPKEVSLQEEFECYRDCSCITLTD